MNLKPTISIEKLSLWIPVILLILPTVMVTIPLIVEIHPKKPIYFTPAFPLFFQILVIAYGALLFWTNPLNMITNHPRVSALTAMLVAIVVYTTFWVALDPFYSAIKVFDLVLIVGVIYFASLIFAQGGTRYIQLVQIALFCSVLITVPLVAFLAHYQIPEYYWWPAFIPGFDYIRIYGFSLSSSIAVGTGILAWPSFFGPGRRWLLIFALGILWSALFWSGSKGGILSLGLVLPTIAVFVEKFRKALFWGILPIFIGLAISSQIASDIPDIGLKNTLEEVVTAESVAEFGAGRLEDWQKVLGFIAERPLLGHGYAQSFSLGLFPSSGRVHIHNIFLEALQAWGIIGASIVGFLILRPWYNGLWLTRLETEIYRIPAFLNISVLLLYAWVDGIYFYHQSLIPLAICAAIMVANPSNSKLA